MAKGVGYFFRIWLGEIQGRLTYLFLFSSQLLWLVDVDLPGALGICPSEMRSSLSRRMEYDAKGQCAPGGAIYYR
jgi:hypothetical protein